MEASDFADIYMEIAEAVGPETAIAIHKLFKGQQIIFPQKLFPTVTDFERIDFPIMNEIEKCIFTDF